MRRSSSPIVTLPIRECRECSTIFRAHDREVTLCAGRAERRALEEWKRNGEQPSAEFFVGRRLRNA